MIPVASLILLVALSYYAGFEETFSLLDNILETQCGADTFDALVVRARDRLFELTGRSR